MQVVSTPSPPPGMLGGKPGERWAVMGVWVVLLVWAVLYLGSGMRSVAGALRDIASSAAEVSRALRALSEAAGAGGVQGGEGEGPEGGLQGEAALAAVWRLMAQGSEPMLNADASLPGT